MTKTEPRNRQLRCPNSIEDRKCGQNSTSKKHGSLRYKGKYFCVFPEEIS